MFFAMRTLLSITRTHHITIGIENTSLAWIVTTASGTGFVSLTGAATGGLKYY
jgi:hypothetical protein